MFAQTHSCTSSFQVQSERQFLCTASCRNSQRHTLLALRSPTSDSMLLECAAAPSISLLDLRHTLALCTLTPLHSSLLFLAPPHVPAVPSCLSESRLKKIKKIHPLIMTGLQTGVWICHIRRQGQAEPRQRGYHSGGVGRAAKWTCHGSTVVS